MPTKDRALLSRRMFVPAVVSAIGALLAFGVAAQEAAQNGVGTSIPKGFVSIGGPIVTDSKIASPKGWLDLQRDQNIGSRPFQEVNHKTPPQND